MKNHKAFSVVELLITLVIATIFITAAYQLYSTVLTDSGDSRKESAASNTAYDYLRRYSAGLTGSCTPSTQTFSNVNVTEVGNTNITVTISCPYALNINQTKPGSYTFTVPSGLTSFYIQTWGGGGGGSSANYATKGGGGGGSGEYRYTSITGATPGSTYNYIVGAGGAGGTGGVSNSSGSSGNSSIVLGPNASLIVAAAGGSGGTISSGGTGGNSGYGGTLITYGGSGFNVTSGNDGGGGGAAGGTMIGSVSATGTAGAIANSGGGGNGGSGAIGSSFLPGSAGSVPAGGGGGGGAYAGPQSGTAGGKGGDGKIVIYGTGTNNDVFKITVSVTYNNPTNTVTYSSYVQV